MPAFKVNFFFKHILGGWSETYYAEDTNITSAAVDAGILAPLRAKLLGVGSELTTIRVSDETITGDSVVESNPAVARVLPTAISDTPWQTVLCSLQAGSIYRRNLAVRGIPDLVYEPVTPTEKTNRDLWFQSLKNDFFARLINAVAGWRERVHLRSADNLSRKILQFTPGVGRYVLTLNSALTAPTVGDFLKITKIREFPSLAGEFPILAFTTVAPFTVDIAANNPTTFVYRHKAECRLQIIGYRQITTANFVRFGSHRVGRPFGEQVGRRRRRVVQAA